MKKLLTYKNFVNEVKISIEDVPNVIKDTVYNYRGKGMPNVELMLNYITSHYPQLEYYVSDNPMRHETPIKGQIYVANRYDTPGKFIKFYKKDGTRKIPVFDDHTSQKNFKQNLGFFILDLVKGKINI